MSFLFTQLKSNTGLQMYKPYVATKESTDVTQKRFSSPIDQTFIIESGRPGYQGAPSASVVIKQKIFGTQAMFPAGRRSPARNFHQICSQCLVDGSLPIAKKIPTFRAPSELPVFSDFTPQPWIIDLPKAKELVSNYQSKLPFGQRMMNQFAGVVGEKLKVPSEQALVQRKQQFSTENEQNLLKLSTTNKATRFRPKRNIDIKAMESMWSTSNVCEELQTVALMSPAFLEIPTLLALDINASINKAFHSIQQRIQQNNERMRHKQS
ncbi:uncharacterized protein LOC103190305 [Callorhinchus milii]|uniref:uncharacterized protein LOC103190305 n=1 Tax=Callorhinchus milii TaxID=7868 RepID=UPI0004571C41|nr:uncharacterized protein LOC103190305 [Callorhinchus milii]|eukprot:gi/632984618/ref/XP_007909229.1/ PREDICTED: uncharacterized protein LOC103190305 [Callorhinchus milii]